MAVHNDTMIACVNLDPRRMSGETWIHAKCAEFLLLDYVLC